MHKHTCGNQRNKSHKCAIHTICIDRHTSDTCTCKKRKYCHGIHDSFSAKFRILCQYVLCPCKQRLLKIIRGKNACTVIPGCTGITSPLECRTEKYRIKTHNRRHSLRHDRCCGKSCRIYPEYQPSHIQFFLKYFSHLYPHFL